MRILCSLMRWIGLLPVVRFLLLVEAGLLIGLTTGILSVFDWLNYVGRTMYFGTLVGGPVLAASLLSPERRPLVLSRPLSRLALMCNLLLAAGLGWILLAVLLFSFTGIWYLLSDMSISPVDTGRTLFLRTLPALALLPHTLLFWLIFEETLTTIFATYIIIILREPFLLNQLAALPATLFTYLIPPITALSQARITGPMPSFELFMQLLTSTLLALLLLTWKVRNLES
ncbi:hypothetical protein ABUL39_04460 [Rhodothermus marinus]|uniref:hypothetical protein n=1 Tax=Rhodothermus marinus TaxID=29549 RepID=UPI0037C6971B